MENLTAIRGVVYLFVMQTGGRWNHNLTFIRLYLTVLVLTSKHLPLKLKVKENAAAQLISLISTSSPKIGILIKSCRLVSLTIKNNSKL